MGIVPFFSADKAYLWAYANYHNRTTGAKLKRGFSNVERNCDYNDIFVALKRLGLPKYEMDIIAKYGKLGRSPKKGEPEEDHMIWNRVMDRLHTELANKDIIVVGTQLLNPALQERIR